MKRIRFFILLLLIVIAGGGCKENGKHAPASLPTRGKLTIGIDESLRPFAAAEIAVFSVYYPGARITPRYLPEKQVIEKLLANDFQTAIICRDLHPAERAFIENEYHHSARSFKLGEDDSKAGDRKQPFTRPVYAVTHEPFTGLGSGFISFMASQKGQLVLSKAGMTPYKPIDREIEILDSFRR